MNQKTHPVSAHLIDTSSLSKEEASKVHMAEIMHLMGLISQLPPIDPKPSSLRKGAKKTSKEGK